MLTRRLDAALALSAVLALLVSPAGRVDGRPASLPHALALVALAH